MTNTNQRTQIVVAGAGYAGLHVAQRLGGWLERHADVSLKLVDEHDYHQLVTELPRVAAGTRAEEAVRVPLETLLSQGVQMVRTTVTAFDLPGHKLVTEAGPLPYTWLVLALGSRPNDFDIPGLKERVLTPYTSEDAQRVWDEVNESVWKAADTSDAREQQRLMTIVIGGGGATGVELAGAFAEEMPGLARRFGAPQGYGKVVLVEAGHTILAGSSPALIARANRILRELRVDVRTNAAIAEATAEGFRLKDGELISGGIYIWAGGVKAPEIVQGSGLPIGYNGRIKVDRYLRALEHPEIFVAGDLASVVDPNTGRALPPLAQIAIEEGDTAANNLRASIDGGALEPFVFHNKGFVVSVGNRRGVADIAGRTIGGRLAHTLKEAIEWEYRQSVKYLRGWGA
jgi:NADH:ubiquinone reductase (H+-translocating)